MVSIDIPSTVAKSTKLALAKACILTFCWAFFRIVVPRLAHIGFNFAQPFLLLRVVREVGAGNISSDTSGGLIGATALIYIGICVSVPQSKLVIKFPSLTLTRLRKRTTSIIPTN